MTHSPGPWKVGPLPDAVLDSEGDIVADLVGTNANLIAAAPDLLDALEWLVRARYEVGSEAWLNAEVVVDKARGEGEGTPTP